MPKYTATISFTAPDDLDARKAVEVAADRLEDYDSDIEVHDTHIEEDHDES
jgi:hypothetical protein